MCPVLLISFGTMYAVAAVLYDQLYAVAFNQSQLLLLVTTTVAICSLQAFRIGLSQFLFSHVTML